MITACTPSMPERATLLAECSASVWAQTVPPAAHLICVEQPAQLSPANVAVARNTLLAGVRTPWVAWIDDDELWDPTHLETFLPYLDDFDVLYSWAHADRPTINLNGWSQRQLVARLEQGNFIAQNALCRLEVMEEVGGYFLLNEAPIDDWAMWLTLARAGYRFACIPQRTWTYRIGDWRHVSPDLGR